MLLANLSGNSPQIIKSTFSNNQAGNFCGGVSGQDSNPTLINITFDGNSANIAGGMYSSNGSPTFLHVTFSNNMQDFDVG